jgi:PAS domain S-box-containing protein
MNPETIFDTSSKSELISFLQGYFKEGMLSFVKKDEWIGECSESFLRTLGFFGENAAFPGLFNSMSESQRNRFIDFLDKILLGEVPPKGQIEVISRRGEVMTMELHGMLPAPVSSDKDFHLLFFVKDITLSKIKVEKHAIFISQAPIAIAMLDLELKYLAVSSKWMTDNKLGNESIIGKTHYEVFPEIGEEWKKIHKECLAGASRRKKEDKFVREDGSIQWLSWEVKPWYNETNTIGGLIIYTEDLTAHKRITEKLNISIDAFQRNFENAGIGMAIVSQEGKWLKVNDEICKILGYTKDEFRNLTFQDITHPDDLATDLGYLREIIKGIRQTYQLEKRYIHKSGHEIAALLVVSVVKDLEGDILYFISQVIDITELKSAQNQIAHLLETTQEQNEKLKNFAHIVSHNLRSHGAGIKVLIDILEVENPHFFELETMSLLKNGVSNLSETIENLKEIVNINLSATTPGKEIELSRILRKTIESVYPLARKDDVEIINEINSEVYVFGIEAYLESIVLNFITNGIKYKSPERKSYLSIRQLNHKDKIEIRFEDNGLGIDLEKHSNALFGMYKTFHRNKDSRGIGLFITKNQIESIGGRVNVKSIVGEGTIFSVFLLKAGENQW